MLHGHSISSAIGLGGYTGQVPGIKRLGIPSLNLNDGPQGFRDPSHPGTSTCWPSGLSIAATWDPVAAGRWGTAMGAEFRAKGANVQLGPGLNVARLPQEGRNFEYISGEEGALGAKLAGPVITGIQSAGIIANAKHYILNSQEYDRGSPDFGPFKIGAPVSEEATERTRWEVYMPPFEAAVRAGVGSVMCAYNRINGTAACADHQTLVADLKGTLGFGGWVMSDWVATHSAVASAVGGLDQEMPLPLHFNRLGLGLGLHEGSLSRQELSAKAARILTAMFAAGLFDRPPDGSLASNVTSPTHARLARSLAANSTVLLRNAPRPAPASAAASPSAASSSTHMTAYRLWAALGDSWRQGFGQDRKALVRSERPRLQPRRLSALSPSETEVVRTAFSFVQHTHRARALESPAGFVRWVQAATVSW